jgi:beta-N-acetylhexosaminidase
MLLIPPAPSAAQTGGESRRLLLQMTPAERVGQLFLVSIPGNRLAAEGGVVSLIKDGRISGVILDWEHGNFSSDADSIDTLRQLVTDLQTVNAAAPLEPSSGGAAQGTTSPAVYVPLFVGVKQEKSIGPIAEVVPGLSEIPSPMAVGGTWDPAAAEATGRLLGLELSALGVNLFLGPSLDVLESPGVPNAGWLGARAFGGDPYWVGRMGASYVAGLQDGSRGKLAVFATHFPGIGNSDRPPAEEVASVRKSIDDLRQIELVPFFAVTGGAPGTQGMIDGVLSSHIRYQGFQGNIRATTRPVSLDREAYDQLIALEPLAEWRESGGVTLSDSLGSQAIRTFVDPGSTDFRGHIVARDAFQAGNDLLLLSDFQSGGDPDELTSIQRALDFFRQKYSEDAVFAERVDAAVVRILDVKLRLYGGRFRVEATLPSPGAVIGRDRSAVVEVAGRAATLISPGLDDVRNRLGTPQVGQRIAVFTDSRPYRACGECPLQSVIGEQALADTIVSLYGPRAAGQVQSWNIRSFSMNDLGLYLGGSPPITPESPLADAQAVAEAVRDADWLVFNTLPEDPRAFGSTGLQTLLDTRPDLVREKRLVVFSYGAPLDLDPTDTSKLDAYYALYSDSAAFVEIAARLLFQEVPASGAAPVGVPGIGYDLIEALSPDANQVLGLSAKGVLGETAETPEAGYRIGDVVILTTGVLLDRNGNPVPDGTPVEFELSYAGENLPAATRTTTVAGMAEINLALDRVGLLSVRVESGEARTSSILQLNVQENVPAFVTVIAPTPVPTDTAIAGGPQVTPTLGAENGGSAGESGNRASPSSLLWAVAVIGGVAALGFAAVRRRGGGLTDRRRAALSAAAGGLVCYDAAAMLLDRWSTQSGGIWWLIGAGAIGAAAGAAIWIVTWLRGLNGPKRD